MWENAQTYYIDGDKIETKIWTRRKLYTYTIYITNETGSLEAVASTSV